MKKGNIDYGDKSLPKLYFRETENKINILTPVLEDLVNKNIYGIEDIFISVYGVDSDEVYGLRTFMKLFEKIDSWDEDYMWDDCRSDKRMFHILN